MSYATINKATDNFNTVLYTGTGSTQSITGVGFQPDMVWGKIRNDTRKHNIYDSVIGTSKRIVPNDTAAESTVAGVTAFNSDGFSVGTETDMNQNTNTFASWNWKAGGTASSNTDGSITSSVSANATSGFSIVSYTATSGTSSIGHGLGTTPSCIILKTLDQTGGWVTGFSKLGWDKYLSLQTTSASTTDDRMFSPSGGTDPTSNLFWSNQSAIASAGTMIAYCFAEKQGYSKFGKYTGNGSTDGTFVYTGFKPAFVMVKRTDNTHNWYMWDNKINPENVIDKYLQANSSNAEGTDTWGDFLSNGFKLRTIYSGGNLSGADYIYMAFAEAPLVGTNNVPCTAR